MADDDVKKEEATEETTAPAEEVAAPAEDTAANAPVDQSADADNAGEEVEVPAEFKDLVDKIEGMTVLELHQLVKVLEKKFGVSAQAVAVAAPGAAAGDDSEEQDAFTVTLKDAGAQKIQVIKAVKELLGLGLKEAKDMVDGAPTELKRDVKKDEAEDIKAKIEEAGGVVEIA